MTSGTLIREARLRAGLSQVELARRSGKDRAQLARWERDVVQPSFETLQEILRACGFDLETTLVPYEPDAKQDARLDKALQRSPQERLQAMLRARGRQCRPGSRSTRSRSSRPSTRTASPTSWSGRSAG